jgi:hypothetical protein
VGNLARILDDISEAIGNPEEDLGPNIAEDVGQYHRGCWAFPKKELLSGRL